MTFFLNTTLPLTNINVSTTVGHLLREIECWDIKFFVCSPGGGASRLPHKWLGRLLHQTIARVRVRALARARACYARVCVGVGVCAMLLFLRAPSLQ